MSAFGSGVEKQLTDAFADSEQFDWIDESPDTKSLLRIDTRVGRSLTPYDLSPETGFLTATPTTRVNRSGRQRSHDSPPCGQLRPLYDVQRKKSPQICPGLHEQKVRTLGTDNKSVWLGH